MIVLPTATAEEKKIAVDKFVATAYNNPALMNFIRIANLTFESATTTPLILHVKQGVAKGGEATISF